MKRQSSSTSSKQVNKKVNFKFNMNDDSFMRTNVMFEGKPMEIKAVINPNKPDLSVKERD